MFGHNSPPAYGNTGAPAAGLRVPLSTESGPAPQHLIGQTHFRDVDGSHVYVASAMIGRSVQPCKVCPHMRDGGVRVAYGGRELAHHGRYDILPITHEMHWVQTSEGRVPHGHRPIEGGFEENGTHLHHALVRRHDGLEVPGKAGAHLGGAHYSFGGHEISEKHNYKILCWK